MYVGQRDRSLKDHFHLRNSELFYIQYKDLKFKDFSANATKTEQTEGMVGLEKSHRGNTNNVAMLWLKLDEIHKSIRAKKIDITRKTHSEKGKRIDENQDIQKQETRRTHRATLKMK